jgi:hypothetical protein
VTGNGAVRAREAGCDVVLEKPCPPDYLRDVIEEVLAKPRHDVD